MLQSRFCALKPERKWFTIVIDPPGFAHVWQLVIVATLDLDHFIKNKLECTPDLLASLKRKVLVDFLRDFDELVYVSCLMLLLNCLHGSKHGKMKDVKVGKIGRLAIEGKIPTSICRKAIKLNMLKFIIVVFNVGCSIVLMDLDIMWAPLATEQQWSGLHTQQSTGKIVLC